MVAETKVEDENKQTETIVQPIVQELDVPKNEL